MSYRDDLTALSARHDALSSEVAQKTKELESASRMLNEAKARARLPILDNIRVASPCSAEWAKMSGDERVRHCGDCQKSVYNLSEMTREEAETLIIAKEGRLCVRYFQRYDGTILLKDCAVGVSKRRKRKLIAAGAAALLAGSAGAALHVTTTATMGDMAIDPSEGRHIEGGLAPRELMGGSGFEPTPHLREKMGDYLAPHDIAPAQKPPVREVKGGLQAPQRELMGKIKPPARTR
jgi:hypothetical protein